MITTTCEGLDLHFIVDLFNCFVFKKKNLEYPPKYKH